MLYRRNWRDGEHDKTAYRGQRRDEQRGPRASDCNLYRFSGVILLILLAEALDDMNCIVNTQTNGQGRDGYGEHINRDRENIHSA